MKQGLIIEDNAQKEMRMREALAPRKDIGFQTCRSIKVAYPMLLGDKWDLILLDMTFQVNLGIGTEVSKEPLAGLEVLQYMYARNIGSPVVVVTQHNTFSDGSIRISSLADLDYKLKRYFPKIYRAVVCVDLASTRWQDELLAHTKAILDA